MTWFTPDNVFDLGLALMAIGCGGLIVFVWSRDPRLRRAWREARNRLVDALRSREG